MSYMMKRINRNWLLAGFVFIALWVSGAREVSNSRINDPAPGATNGLLVVQDNKYGLLGAGWFNKAITARVLFGLNEDRDLYFAQSKIKFEVTFDVKAYTGSAFTVYTNQKLDVLYDRQEGTEYKDAAVWSMANVDRMEVTVTGVTAMDMSGSPVMLSVVPPGIYLEGEIETERYYTFLTTTVPPNTSTKLNRTYIAATNEYEVYWDYIAGAEAYQLEWTHVNTDGSVPVTSYAYDFKNNATRVTTKQNWYRIPNLYQPGVVLFRLRALGYAAPNYDVRLEGAWTTANANSPESGTIGNYPGNALFTTNGLPGVTNVNWSADMTFDENGRMGQGVAFADGLLKSRQTVAKLNTAEKVMISSSMYDFNGRPAVNFLPTPLNSTQLKYYVNNYQTNPGSGLIPYDKHVFDTDNTANCSIASPGIEPNVSGSSGAEKYYSPFNPNQEGAQAMVPDAEKYPFVQVEYTPDLTGRIRSTSLPGSTHRLGAGRELKMLYANPGSQELDRLFGSEVGLVNHYRKHASVDANGQIAVTYVDMLGRTIATALSGEKPAQLDAIEGYNDPSVSLTDNLLLNNRKNPVDYTIESTKTIFVESPNNVQQLRYDLDAEVYNSSCSPLCFDCVYEVEISVKDECGNELFDFNPSTLPLENTVVLGNMTPLDGVCQNNVPVGNPSGHFSLPGGQVSVTFPLTGTYLITKKLKVSDIPLETYADLYVKNNTCLSLTNLINEELNDIDFSSCGYTCAQCVTALNTYTVTHPLPAAVYAKLLAECNEQCEENDDPCEAYREAMLADVRPGGQFGTYQINGNVYNPFYPSVYSTTGNWQSTSINYTDEDGNPFVFKDASGNPVANVMGITFKEFVEQFQDHWDVLFLDKHPEYCYLEFCNKTAASLKYDEAMRNTETYDEACRKGLIIPIPASDFTAGSGSCGFGISTPAAFPATSCASGQYSSNYDPFFMANPSTTDNSQSVVASAYSKCYFLNEMGVFNRNDLFCTPVNFSTIPFFSGNVGTPGNTPAGFTNVGCGAFALAPNPNMSMYEFAVKVANCNGASSCGSGNGAFGVSCNKDMEWVIFRTAYLMKKQVLYEKARAAYAVVKGCYNGRMASGGSSFDQSQLGAEFISCVNVSTYNNLLPKTHPLTSPLVSPGTGCSPSTFYNGTQDNNQTVSVWYHSNDFTSKTPRFMDVSMMAATNLNAYGQNLTGSTAGSGNNAGVSNVLQQGQEHCTANAENWMQILSNCVAPANNLPIGDVANTTLYANIKNALIDVCSRGVDANNPFGASAGVNTGGGTYGSFTSFQGVLTNYLSLNGNTPGCNALLITMPEPKNHSTSSGANSTEILGKCGCDKIFDNEAAYALLNSFSMVFANVPLNYSEADLFNHLNPAETPVTEAFYAKLKCKCKQAVGVAQNVLVSPRPHVWTQAELNQFTGLGSEFTVPGVFGCPHCISCDMLTKAKNDLLGVYTGATPPPSPPIFSSPITVNHPNWPVVSTNYFNNTFNFNLTFEDYEQFMVSCGGFGQRTGGVGTGSWIPQGAGIADQSGLNPLAGDVFGVLKRYAATWLRPDVSKVLTLTTAPEFFKPGLVPDFNAAEQPTVALRTMAVGSNGLKLAFNRLNGSHSLYDTLTLKLPTGGSGAPLHTWSELKEVIEFYGRTDTAFNGRMQGFYLSAVFNSGSGDALQNDTLLLEGYSNTQHFGNRVLASCFIAGISTSKCLCNDPKLPVVEIEDDCMSTLINQANLNAENKYEELLTLAKQEFIKNYKAKCFTVIETFTRSYALKEYHYTLYYYNQAGNLARTVPPKGVSTLVSAGDLQQAAASHLNTTAPRIYPAHTYISAYEYRTDGTSQKQESPDQDGASVYFYDYLGRIVASQNARQAVGPFKRYSYTLYDGYGRITEVGELKGNTSSPVLTTAMAANPQQLQTFLNHSSFTRNEVVRTYYDAVLSAAASAEFSGGQQNLRNRVSAVTYENVNDNAATTYDYGTHYSYDEHGNVTEVVQETPGLDASGLRYRHIEYAYDLISGNVNQTYYEKGRTEQFIHRYQYDRDNRLSEVYTSKDGVFWDRDAKQLYYEHGPLARVELGRRQVQGQDFAYTLHGWLKGLNSERLNTDNDMGRDGDDASVARNEFMSQAPNIHSTFARDAAGYGLMYYHTGSIRDYKSIKYRPMAYQMQIEPGALQQSGTGFNIGTLANGEGPALYNGNISAMVTGIYNLDATSTDYGKALPQVSAYRYDQLQRIKQMRTYKGLFQQSGQTLNAWATPGAGPYADYGMTFSYDRNGNLTQLTRNGPGSGLSMDNLSYTYDEQAGISARKTNRLIGVRDVVNPGQYPDDIDDQGQALASDVSKASWNYDYDAMGNLIKDKQEHIGQVEWTVDGKVSKINRDGLPKMVNGQAVYLPNIEYSYNAQRQRVSKTVKPQNAGGTLGEWTWTSTYYVHDANGTVRAIYSKHYEAIDAANGIYEEVIQPEELYIYGSERIGYIKSKQVYRRTVRFSGGEGDGAGDQQAQSMASGNAGTDYSHITGERRYELQNHLGNVLSVVTDKKLAEVSNSGTVLVDFESGESYVSNAQGGVSGQWAQELGPGTTVYGTTIQMPIPGNTMVNAQVYVKNPGATATGALVLQFNDMVTNATLGYYPQTFTGTNMGSYALVSVNGTAPVSANGVKVAVYCWNPTAGTQVYVDDLSMSVSLPVGMMMVRGYKADIRSATDYYAGGTPELGRTFNGSEYRYGMNGKEKDDEIVGSGNSYDFGARMYSPRLGKFLSIDPLTMKYPWLTPYQYASNTPIQGIDIDGLEVYYAADGSLIGKIGDNTKVRVVNAENVEKVTFYVAWANNPDLPKTHDYATKRADQFSTDAGMSNEELNTRVMLTLIKNHEGGKGSEAYNTWYGGDKFESTDDHPGANSDGNSAAGAYQILKGSWNDEAYGKKIRTKYGIKDFSAKSQDKFTVGTIKDKRKALDLVKAGDFKGAIAKLKKEWVSLPGGSQSNTSQSKADAEIKDARANELKGNSEIATPKGELLDGF